jgi:iron complex outermembrane receptor protein
VEWRHFRDELSSIGIEDSVKIGEKLDLTVGVALDRQNPKEKGSDSRTGIPYEANAQTFFQGQFGVFWKTTDSVHTYITVARKNRFPTLSDRFSQRFDRYIANPDLKAEQSMNYDVGAKAKLASWITIEGALFYSDITDLIEEVANVQGSLSQMQNIGKARHQGVELSFHLKPASWLESGIFYTYLHRENVSNPESRLMGVPKNRLTGFVKFAPLTQLYLFASVESQTGTWSTTTDRLGGYTTANLTIGYEPIKAITIDGGYTNILDKDYQNVLYYPSPGRTWFVNGRYRF